MSTLQRRRYGRRFYPNKHAAEYRKNLFKLQKQIRSKHFLLKCRKFDLMPRFIMDKKKNYFSCLYNTDHPFKNKVEKIIATVQRKMLNMSIKICCWNVRNLGKIVNHQKQLLYETCDTEVSDHIIEQLEDEAHDISMDTKTRLIKKFEGLQHKQNKDAVQFDCDSVINLTNKEVPMEVIKLLSLGPKVSVSYDPVEAPIPKLIADVENFVRTLDKDTDQKDTIRNDVAYAASRYLRSKKHQTYEMSLLKEMLVKTKKFLKENDDICFLAADKGKKSVIMLRSEYEQKVLQLLSDSSTYTLQNCDPTKKITAMITKHVKKLHEKEYIKSADLRYILSANSLPPALYCLVKIHKVNHPMRPIVSTIASPHSMLAKYLAGILNNITDPGYNLNNSQQLKEKLVNMKIPKHHKLISFDVVSLFTNVPIDCVFEIIDRKWNIIRKYTDIPLVQFRELMRIVLVDCNYFIFNNAIYKQTFGLPMGSPLAPVLSCILLDDLLMKSIRKSTYKPKFIYKYVDDLISEIHPDKIDYFVDILNKYHDRIKFTYELEENNVLNYLDLKIIHLSDSNKNELKFDWYQKAISSSRLLNYISHHPEIQKVNVASNFIWTVLKLSDSEFHYNNFGKIRNCLSLMNYLEKLVEKLIKEVTNKIKHQQQQMEQRNLRHRETDKDKEAVIKRYVGVKYIHKLSENVVKICRNYNLDVEIAHTTGNNLNDLYSKQKHKYNKMCTKDTVYKINCKGGSETNCDKTYVGTTGRPLNIRMEEHARDVKRGDIFQKSHTALAEHAVNEGHMFDTENPKILCKESCSRKRILLESFNIFMSKNTVNYRQDTEGINKIYKNILSMLC